MWEAMLSRLRTALGDDENSLAGDCEADLALACLLMEAAAADGRIDEEERKMIARLLARRGLRSEQVTALIRRAETLISQSVQILAWTKTLKDSVPLSERVDVIAHLFAVAYADGRLDPLEDQLIRRVAGLLYVPDRERGRVHRQIRGQLGVEHSPSA